MQTLARIPFFKDAGDIDFARFDRRCSWRRYEANETIVDFEDTSSDICFIITGDVRILNRTPAGKEIILAEMRAGRFKHRLYSELLRLAHGRVGHDGQKIVSPPPFHHVLAARIGCRREQVTRELSALSQEGLIEKNRGGLGLVKPKVLEARLEEALRAEG